MSTVSPLHSHACCTVPPVEYKGYKEKGKFIEIEGVKTYFTGPDDAKKAIFIYYDVFGYWPQNLQGADILAYGDKDQPYKVFIPDFFDGTYSKFEWYPPDTPEKEKVFGDFLNNVAAPPKHIPRVPKLIADLKRVYAKGIEDWGVVGFCWGGKMVSLTSGEGTLFKAAAEAHPAMVDAEDAKKVTIPLIMLGSSGEEKKDIDAFEAALKTPGFFKHYPDQAHGFMAARADLEDEKVKKAYEEGFKHILDFFHEHV